MAQNSLGLIFLLLALSIGYVSITGVLRDAMRADATAEMRRRCVLGVVTLPVLGIAITLSAPHYAYGLAGAGLVLGFLLTLNSVTQGMSALTTEPTSIGILYCMALRSRTGGNTVNQIETLIGRFGYQLTVDHVGFLTGGIAAGIVLGIIPRMVLKVRAHNKAAQPRLNARQLELKKKKAADEKAALNAYSRKARKSGRLVERMRALND